MLRPRVFKNRNRHFLVHHKRTTKRINIYIYISFAYNTYSKAHVFFRIAVDKTNMTHYFLFSVYFATSLYIFFRVICSFCACAQSRKNSNFQQHKFIFRTQQMKIPEISYGIYASHCNELGFRTYFVFHTLLPRKRQIIFPFYRPRVNQFFFGKTNKQKKKKKVPTATKYKQHNNKSTDFHRQDCSKKRLAYSGGGVEIVWPCRHSSWWWDLAKGCRGGWPCCRSPCGSAWSGRCASPPSLSSPWSCCGRRALGISSRTPAKKVKWKSEYTN